MRATYALRSRPQTKHVSWISSWGKQGEPVMSNRRFGMALLLAFGLAGSNQLPAAETNSTVRLGGFQFDGKISRPVLENYLSRSICIEGMLNGRGPLTDDIRMITNCDAKYIARALCLWGAENNFLANIERAKEQVPQIVAVDP